VLRASHRDRSYHFVIAVWKAKEAESAVMNPRKTTITVLAILSASLAVADDFKTINGKEYKDATVTHVEPDGIVVKTKTGISKIYFQEPPKEVQQRFNYNPEQAAAYSAQQNAAQEQLRGQQKGKAGQLEQRGCDKKGARRIAKLCSEISVARVTLQNASAVIAGGSGARFAAASEIQRQEQRIQKLQKNFSNSAGAVSDEASARRNAARRCVCRMQETNDPRAAFRVLESDRNG